MQRVIPLCVEAIEAANRLYAYPKDGSTSDRALDLLVRQIPGFELDAALLKVLTINSLYSTNVYAIRRMAEHVHKVMCEVRHDTDPVEVVELLAKLPVAREAEKPRRFVSFASKFAHYFIDQHRFAILDSHTVWMIPYHLGSKGCVKDEEHPYRAFLLNLQKLRDQSGFAGTFRELDGYLWLAGELRQWCRKPEGINREMRELFEHPPAGAVADLALLKSLVSVPPTLKG